MTVPRKEILTPDEPTYYHCYTRCVRRAFLCGKDKVSGKCYEHRREWIRSRLDHLLDIFAMDEAAYAVMMNHLHTLLRTRPDVARKWSDKEVARRWRLLFPYRRKKDGSPCEPSKEEIRAITESPETVELYRQRLSSISWFNRCLNEHIARQANKEDGCTGRFWEGRFRSERLETEAAVVACSVYIDLNPIRAGIARTLEESDFTSIKARIQDLSSGKRQSTLRLLSVDTFSGGRLTEAQYLSLVDETARSLAQGKASMKEELLPLMERIGLKPQALLTINKRKKKLFRRVIGPVASLSLRAESMGKRWLHGKKGAELLFL